MQYFKRIIGDYRVDKFTGSNLNTPRLQYNSFHEYLGGFPDIILQKPFYIPYSDTGLFGNFIYGNSVFNPEMSLITQNKMSTYAQNVFFLLFRSIKPKFIELETNIGMICSKAQIPSKSQSLMPIKQSI